MRPLCLVFLMLALLSIAVGQSLQIDEHACRVTLKGETYTAVLLVNSAAAVQGGSVKLEIIAPSGSQLAFSYSPAELKLGTNKLSASVTLPALPKKTDDLLWYRLGYSITANGAELAHGILPLFESVQDFALHVSAPAMVQPGKKFFVRVHTSHPVLNRPVSGVAITAQVRGNANESAFVAATGTTSLPLPGLCRISTKYIRSAISAESDRPPTEIDPVASTSALLHPEMATIYRTNVTELAKARQEPDSRSEATVALRGPVMPSSARCAR